jgi:hypothetical protein
MRKLTVLAAFGLALIAFGCAGQVKHEGQPVTKETKIKCPKCGATFTLEDGLEASSEVQ